MILMPTLDTRDWDQLLQELRRDLPRLDRTWNEYNHSDPAITVLELFAYLTETALFRADRTPPELERALLRLVGIEPAPAGIAQTILATAQAAPGPAPVLPAGLQIEGGGVIFETLETLTVAPATLVALATDAGDGTALGAPDPAFDPARPAAAPILPLGPAPKPGAALLLGLSGGFGTQGAPVRLHLWADGFPGDGDTLARLQAEARARAQACIPDPCHRPPAAVDRRAHYSARTVWEFKAAGDRWLPLPEVRDDTRALSLSGAIAFAAPPEAGPDAPAPQEGVAGDITLRCRLAAGQYDRAPRLRDIAINTVAIHHTARRPDVRLGVSMGAAMEDYWLPEHPVIAGSVRLRLRREGVDDLGWRAPGDHDLSGPFDRDLALDAIRGQLVSGDGRQGAPCPTDAEIHATYSIGGGTTGNVKAGTLSRLARTEANTTLTGDTAALAASVILGQRHDARGGHPAETLHAARARAVRMLETPDKAVTVADHERLAHDAPGLPLARVWAVPGLHPLLPTVHAEGCVTLVVLPEEDGPAPTPSQALLDALATWMEPRRLVTTELHVIGPCWVDLSVGATLHLGPGAAPDAILRAASGALDAALHPLTGGPEGTGWPPGRDVHAAEAAAWLEAVPGVAGVGGVVLHHGAPPRGACDRVRLCRNDLPRVRPHRLVPEPHPGAAPTKGPDNDCCC